MQITMEKIVWITLSLVIVAVVGWFLMGVATTHSNVASQKVYARLIQSSFNENCPDSMSGSCYVVSIRIVNPGEGGMSLYMIQESFGGGPVVARYDSGIFLMITGVFDEEPMNTLSTVGFRPGDIIWTYPDLGMMVEIPPHEALDVTIEIDSVFVDGEKALIVSPFVAPPGLDFIDPSEAERVAVSIPIP